MKVVLLRKGGERIKGVNLYIRNVLKSWIVDDLKVFFIFYGNIINVKIFIDKILGVFKGVGFVFYNLKLEVEVVI